MNLDDIRIEKMFIILCLFSALILTFWCPCKVLLSCHRFYFYALLLLPLLLVFFKQP